MIMSKRDYLMDNVLMMKQESFLTLYLIETVKFWIQNKKQEGIMKD